MQLHNKSGSAICTKKLRQQNTGLKGNKMEINITKICGASYDCV
jgi:hypothetical protein